MENNTENRRGRFANALLNEMMCDCKAEEQSPEESLLGTYLDHQVAKRQIQYLLAGVNGGEVLGDLVREVVQLSFSVLLSLGRDELEDALNIHTELRVLAEYELSPAPSRLGQFELGRSTALGRASADAGSVMHIRIGLSEKQMLRLHDHPWALPHILRSLDTIVPIDSGLEIGFRLRPTEGSFHLTNRADGRVKPTLGMTTALVG